MASNFFVIHIESSLSDRGIGPALGGLGVVVLQDGHVVHDASIPIGITTRDAAAALSAVAALRAVPSGSDVEICTDRENLINAMTINAHRSAHFEFYALLDKAVAEMRAVNWIHRHTRSEDRVSEYAKELAKSAKFQKGSLDNLPPPHTISPPVVAPAIEDPRIAPLVGALHDIIATDQPKGYSMQMTAYDTLKKLGFSALAPNQLPLPGVDRQKFVFKRMTAFGWSPYDHDRLDTLLAEAPIFMRLHQSDNCIVIDENGTIRNLPEFLRRRAIADLPK